MIRSKKIKHFEILEHPADLKIRAWGKIKEELFVNMARGMFFNLVDSLQSTDDSKNRIKKKFKIESTDLGALLVDFLNQLNYLADLHNAIFDQFKIKIKDDKNLEAEVSGYKAKSFALEIKAVTYHGLVVKKEKGRWIAEVLFDI
jgi:SHS2 domain-containing protein